MTKKNIHQIEQIELENLIPYARNSRTHTEAQVAQIAASIREFGFTNPVLIGKDNDIIAGHGRVLAARKLQLDKVPCLRLGHLTDIQKQAYVIADNRIALNAGWDEEMLKLELKELMEKGVDTEVLGFSDEEIAFMTSDGTLSETILSEENAKTPKEQMEDREEKDSRQIIFVYAQNDYNKVIEAIDQYASTHDLENNGEVLAHLLNTNDNENTDN
jgi:ParB-like chromosome segregation protein Spo0J